MDKKGNFYFLEVNSMASLGSSESFASSAKAGGYNFDEMICKLLEVGIYKYSEKHPKLKEQYDSRHCTDRK